MRKILILVEGQTEETFVRDVLQPMFATLGLQLIAKLVTTRWVKAGGHFKGGITRFDRVANDLRRLLGDSSAALVTTMFDYYGLPTDFPGLSTRPSGDCYARVAHVEAALAHAIGDPRFVPYLALHEFEALLFTDPQACPMVFSPKVAARLAAIRSHYGSPEEINESPSTAPSKRILQVMPDYDKALLGSLAIVETSVAAVRRACPHFASWLERIESLGAA